MRPMSHPDASETSADDPVDLDDRVIAVALRRSLVAACLLVIVIAGGWFLLQQRPPMPVMRQAPLTLPTGRDLPALTIPSLPFTDITAEAGIRFTHQNGAAGEKLLPETMGSGCGFIDFDNDGDQDLVLVNARRWPWDERADAGQATTALYQNDGTGQFTDITAGSGLDASLYGTGLAFGDVDSDGLTDVFIACVGNDRLFRNLGEGRFQDITEVAGIAGPADAWSTSCGFFDADADGDLDLFVCNYVEWSRDLDRGQDFRLVDRNRAYGRPQNFGGSCARLYQNDGGGHFNDVSAAAGICVMNPATGASMAKSLGLAFDDLDGDGATDVVVANDTVQNFLFHNRGDGTFAEVGGLTGLAFDMEGRARGAMGIDIGRFRNDADIGIVIGNFANEMTALYVSRNAALAFRDDAISNGLGPPTRLELTFGVAFADVDLDGRLDILAANGHLEEDINRVQRTQFYAQPPRLYWNCGTEYATEFVPVPKSSTGEGFARPLVGRSLSVADIDADGDLDCLITASGGPPRLLRNEQALGHHWLRLRLVGTSPNKEAIGAVVTLHRGLAKESAGTQFRCVSPTRGYQSQSELPVTFGLGSDPDTGTVRIRWPDGGTTEHVDLAPDRLHVIRR